VTDSDFLQSGTMHYYLSKRMLFSNKPIDLGLSGPFFFLFKDHAFASVFSR
jgi:hypothetical protein